MPARKKALYTARAGVVQVPVYPYGDGRYCVAWQSPGEGRKRETFSTKKEACARADDVANSIAHSRADVLTLTSADRDSYRIALQKLDKIGATLLGAVEEYVAAKEIAGARSLVDAAKLLAVEDRKDAPPASAVLTELLNQLQDDRRSASYTVQLERDLKRFVEAYPDLRAVTEQGIRDYLRGLKTTNAASKGGVRVAAGSPVSARRRDNVRDGIVLLMRFAERRKYVPQTHAETVPRVSEGADVTTYSPEQLGVILNYFDTQDREWLPWAAIAAFAGLRTSEILRLDWSAIKWEEGTIAISKAVARKVRVSRQAPLLPVLRAWLESFRAATGPVIATTCADIERAKDRALKRMRTALEWEGWQSNALRHSFGSNRLAVVKSYDQVALEMGNSPSQVREHYNDPKPESEAQKYFAVMPPAEAKNVVKFRR